MNWNIFATQCYYAWIETYLATQEILKLKHISNTMNAKCLNCEMVPHWPTWQICIAYHAVHTRVESFFLNIGRVANHIYWTLVKVQRYQIKNVKIIKKQGGASKNVKWQIGERTNACLHCSSQIPLFTDAFCPNFKSNPTFPRVFVPICRDRWDCLSLYPSNMCSP